MSLADHFRIAGRVAQPLLLLLLLVVRQIPGQETTTVTVPAQSVTDPAQTVDGMHVWTVLEDDVMAIDDFTGNDIPAPDLQQVTSGRS